MFVDASLSYLFPNFFLQFYNLSYSDLKIFSLITYSIYYNSVVVFLFHIMSDSITITNPRIVNFYKDNNSVDFEAVNIIFVDLFEKLFTDMHSTMNSTLNSQILSQVRELNSKVEGINSSLSVHQTDLVSQINNNFAKSKAEFTEELTSFLSAQTPIYTEKTRELIGLSAESLIDKTTLLLNDMLPKSQQHLSTIVHEQMNTIQSTLSNDIRKIENHDQLHQFIQSFDVKSSAMLQPIFSYISSSEERLSQNISVIKDSNALQVNTQEKVFAEISDFLGKYKNSSYKGQFGENQLESVLNKMYPAASVTNNTSFKASCDFSLVREKFPTILIETKHYDRNVNLEEVKKFYRDIEEQQTHGIFLSQQSGITSKQNFQIDIFNNNVLVFVHNTQYDPQIIKIAVDIVDSISQVIPEVFPQNNDDHAEDVNEDNTIIRNDIIDAINADYKAVISRKTNILEINKDFQRKLISELDAIQLPSLLSFLKTKFPEQFVDSNQLICDICNTYASSTNKGLAAHKRACKKKLASDNSEVIIQIES